MKAKNLYEEFAPESWLPIIKAMEAGNEVSKERLAAALRGDQKIPDEARALIADLLEGKGAKGRGRPIKNSFSERFKREIIQHVYKQCYATVLDEKRNGEADAGSPTELAFETTAAACSDLFFEEITPATVKNIIYPSRPRKAR